MIVKRILFTVISLAALAAAAAITVFAAAFALYALLRDQLTPPGAAAAVALAAAAITALAALIAARKVKSVGGGRSSRSHARGREAPNGLLDHIIEIARERPLIAAGAATAAGLLAFANPALLTAVMRAFVPAQNSRRR